MIASIKRRLQRTRNDSGFTLTELIVSMGIFTMVLVVFMGAVSTMSGSAVRSQVVSDTTSQMRTVFERLDREVRYASDINPVGVSAGNHYVEYLVPASTGTGQPQCVQWRVVTDENELQRRTWAPGDSSTVSGWATMVTGLRNDVSDTDQQPFAMHRAGRIAGDPDPAVYLHQRLSVYLDAGIGEARSGEGSQLEVTLVARNSSTSSPTNSTPAQQVCLGDGIQRP